MRLIDEIATLRSKVSHVRVVGSPSSNVPSNVDIIDTALSARLLLSTLEGLDFSQYGHHLKTTIRTTQSVNDPNHPSFAKAEYAHNKNIALKSLLGAMVHRRYLSVRHHADGNHCLVAQSDRHSYEVFYSDFIESLKSLLISERLAVLALCDLSERFLRDKSQGLGTNKEIGGPEISHQLNLLWLLRDSLRGNHTLKQEIMKTIFGVVNVPPAALSALFFFQSQIGPGYGMVIGFGPSWEEGQEVMSPPFEPTLLFDLIRDSYK